jgi:hypothetical protein
LYDREQAYETELRHAAIKRVNARHGCRGFLTTKRSLENYLHPQAIVAAEGPQLEINDETPVAQILAQENYNMVEEATRWEILPFRTRRKRIYRAKRWLNTIAVERMTLALLHERDPMGDVLLWLGILAKLLRTVMTK